jgi:hypothetical protein
VERTRGVTAEIVGDGVAGGASRGLPLRLSSPLEVRDDSQRHVGLVLRVREHRFEAAGRVILLAQSGFPDGF